ncbi:MAG: PilN domain-containing protein [Proteobacteria bacterium]|nr:PilN domain-containing protein [Pseudomonadota bacterium]
MFTSGAMLQELMTWWAQQWLDLLPLRFAEAGRWNDALVIDLAAAPQDDAPSRFALVRRRHGEERVLGQFAADEAGLAAVRRGQGRRLPCLLRLPPGMLLEHRFAMPLAAERDAARVLHYEIDRVTPFAADDVFWTWSAERRDRERHRVFVRLSLVSRNLLQPLIARLAAAGITVRSLEARVDDGSLRHVPLAEGGGRSALSGAVLLGLMATCVVLAGVAAGLPFILQQERIQHVRHEIALLQPRVAEAGALRRRITGQAAGADIITAEESRVGDALQALAAITTVLPDSTFLTALNLSHRVMALTGQSPDPAALIARMAADPLIRDPSFSAPVTAAPDGHGSLFSINAKLAP